MVLWGIRVRTNKVGTEDWVFEKLLEVWSPDAWRTQLRMPEEWSLTVD
jgi:hypothetical protein